MKYYAVTKLFIFTTILFIESFRKENIFAIHILIFSFQVYNSGYRPLLYLLHP